MVWEGIIDQMKEWVQAQDYLTTGFVNRGDPAINDWVTGNFVRDGAWHDLDLSSIVPDGAKGVSLFLWYRNTVVGEDIKFRTNGNVNTKNLSNKRTNVANIFDGADLTVPCDANRLIEYWIGAVGVWTIVLNVKGWWL